MSQLWYIMLFYYHFKFFGKNTFGISIMNSLDSYYRFIGTTNARVAYSFVFDLFTWPFLNQRMRSFRLLLITRERLSQASYIKF